MSKPNNYQLTKGQIIGNWEVVEPSVPAPGNVKNKRPFTKAKCLEPNCTTVKEINTYDLVKGNTKNCGCTRKKDVIGKPFNSWTVISKSYFDHDTYYNCKCECGNDGVVKLSDLTGGGSKSCGCKNKITTIKEAKQKAVEAVFNKNKSDGRHYSNGNLPIGLCGLLIQLPCFYCGRIGVNDQNFDNTEHSEFVKINARLDYNGLDRFSDKVSKTHDMNNVVPTCPQCNFFKLDIAYKEMLKRIPNLKENPEIITADKLHKVKDEIKLLEDGKIQAKNPTAKTALGKLYPEKSLAPSKNVSYLIDTISHFMSSRREKRYAHIENKLAREDVAEMKLGDCIYCGNKSDLKNNNANTIDRIDPNNGYVLENCVCACMCCNSAKSDLTLEEFIEWIKTIKANFNNLPKTESEVLELINGGYFIEQARKMEIPDYFDYLNK